jgi:hypothetical protein
MRLRYRLALLAPLAFALALPSAAQDLYQQALQSISEGRSDDASRELSDLVKQEPLHAGAWLDLAMTQCALGRGDEAERMFAVIETRFAPSRALLEMIAQVREQGCTRWRPVSTLQLSAGRGIESNVNQGASISTFSFGGQGEHYEQTLSDDFIPKHDQYSLLVGEATRQLTPNGLAGFAQFQLRHYDRLHGYDSATLFAGLESSLRWQRWSLRNSVSAGLVSLGGRIYQRQAQFQVRAAPPVTLPGNTQLGVSGGVTYNSFPTLTNFNAATAELRGQLVRRSAAAHTSVSLGVQHDHALGQRPGGDRDGWYANLLYRRLLGARSSAELSYTRQTWNNKLPYAPGLIEQVRKQSADIVRVDLTYSLGKKQFLQLEGRMMRNRENIPIFQYDNRLLQLSWVWQAF